MEEAEAQPAPGDFGLCIRCGEWFTFVLHGARKPTEAELEEIGLDPLTKRYREAWVAVNTPRGVPS